MENKRTNPKDSNIVSFMPNGDYYFQKALQELDREQMDKAYKYIKRAAELSPDDAQILLQYGILQMDLGKFEHAYELIHTAYSIEPSNPDIVFMLAEISGYVGFIHDAQKYASKYLELEPNGVYRLEAEDILQFAEEEQDLVIDIDDEEKGKIIAVEKSRRFMEEGDFQQAITVLEEAIELYPTEWSAYNNLALAYFYLQEIEQAKALLNHVMRETNNANLHALCNLAVIAYSEGNEAELQPYIDALNKIQPYNFDNRHKLGVTLALIGEHAVAFKWLHSLQKKGYEGDTGFYYWLANSAYFSGYKEYGKTIWNRLLELDPSKIGLEPWLAEKSHPDYLPTNDREYIINKLNGVTLMDKMVGCFLLKFSPHKQEIIAHPNWIQVDSFNEIEKLVLAYVLGYPLNSKVEIEKLVQVAMDAAQLIVEKTGDYGIVTMWSIDKVFEMFMLSLETEQHFKNAKGLAATADYVYMHMFGKKVTKKEIADKYEISTSTLTKNCNIYFEAVPGIKEIVFD